MLGITIAVFLIVAAGQADELTQAALLDHMTNLDRLADPPAPGERSLLFSSYDRRQHEIKNNRYAHWDADNDSGQFIRNTSDGWNVMAEIDGPGVIQHIWCDKPAGKVRIELDGKTVIEADFVELFDGGVAPFGDPLSYFTADGQRGANLYFPIGFARECRIATRGFDGEYQIDATGLPPGTRVETFKATLSEDATTALDALIASFRTGLPDARVIGERKTMAVAVQQDLAHGEKFSEDFAEPGTIRSLLVSLTDRTAPREMYAMHNCIIRIFWDGHTTPDIELPLSSFFGSGFDRNPYNSLAMGTDRWLDLPGLFPSESYFMYCLFPMPFQQARVEIENRNEKKIGLMLYMRVEQATPDPARLRFRAHFRRESPCKTFDFPLLETTGPGRIVGCVLNIDTPRKDWWGRGDHKLWIDGEPFPSMLGTSTAGYFANVVPLVKADRPLHGASLVNPHGKNSLYRWHLADAISFQRSVRFTIENWQPDNANDVFYNSIVYWYGPAGAAETGDRLTQADLAVEGLRIPGAVEIEGRVAGSGWGNVLKQKYAGRVELSGQAGANVSTDKPVEIDIPCETAGRYKLSLRVHPTRSFETVEVASGDGGAIGAATYGRTADGIYLIGEIELQAGDNRVRVTCARPTVLDCWILERIGS